MFVFCYVPLPAVICAVSQPPSSPRPPPGQDGAPQMATVSLSCHQQPQPSSLPAVLCAAGCRGRFTQLACSAQCCELPWGWAAGRARADGGESHRLTVASRDSGSGSRGSSHGGGKQGRLGLPCRRTDRHQDASHVTALLAPTPFGSRHFCLQTGTRPSLYTQSRIFQLAAAHECCPPGLGTGATPTEHLYQ